MHGMRLGLSTQAPWRGNSEVFMEFYSTNLQRIWLKNLAHLWLESQGLTELLLNISSTGRHILMQANVMKQSHSGNTLFIRPGHGCSIRWLYSPTGCRLLLD